MAIDFPASPTVGQTFTAGTITYTWDGTKWNASSFPSTFGLGTAASPSITFSGDTDTGLYSPGANQVAISTNGTGRLFVDASGRVGVNNSSPGGQLSVERGDGHAVAIFNQTNGSWNNDVQLNHTSAPGAFLLSRRASGDAWFYQSGSYPISFHTNASERLRITSAGLVGIGTSSPARTLDVNGTARIADGSAIEWGGTSAFIAGTSTSNALQFFTASTERFRVDSTGNLTINSQGDLRFGDADNSNWVAFQAPATVASNVTWTLPAADGTASQVLGTNGSGVLSFLTAGASLNVAAKSANYTAVAADKSYLFTCTGSWTLSLTAAATLGNGWYLFLNNPGTGQITVDPDGSELIGGATTAVLNPGDLWLIACDGSGFVLNRLAGNNYQIFNSSGTFTVPAGVERIFVEAWGGGAGGGMADTASTPAPGGGAGGYSAGWLNVAPAQTITATVGAGGSGTSTSNQNTPGGQGGSTTFSTFTANGGTSLGGRITVNTSMVSEGGSASGGNINIKGNHGSGITINISGGAFISYGGIAPKGGSGGVASNANSNAGQSQDPEVPGGGGAGGVVTSPARNGQTGAAGRIIVYWV